VRAKTYESGGAAALSVLTDQAFFGGSVDDLQRARAAVEIPALRKDFTIDETQVYESRVVGADAVLLIVAALTDDGLLTGLRELAEEVGIVALVEAHDDAELDRALAAGASIVGVNARDLGTFGEDLGLSERLADRIPGEVTAVAESAIRAPADAERMAEAGYDAVLVGEALVRSDDPTRLVDAIAEVPATAAPVRSVRVIPAMPRPPQDVRLSCATPTRMARSSRASWLPRARSAPHARRSSTGKRV